MNVSWSAEVLLYSFLFPNQKALQIITWAVKLLCKIQTVVSL